MRVALSHRACTSRIRHRRGRGQGLVEFAIVAPVFFFVIFALIDGGFLLYTVNTVAQTATIGSNMIAAQGRIDTADITGLQKMASAGLETTPLVKVQEIDVEQLVTNASGNGFNTDASGAPVIATGCPTGPNGGQCVNEYNYTGSGSAATVHLINGAGTCSDGSGCPPWPPSARDVSSETASFVALNITYKYTFFTDVAGSFTLTTTKTFRLEPQSS